MTENFLKNAKAYVGLIGAVITSLLGTVPPDGDLWQVLTYISAVLTAITIYSVPNKDITGQHQDESVQPVNLDEIPYEDDDDEPADYDLSDEIDQFHGGTDADEPVVLTDSEPVNAPPKWDPTLNRYNAPPAG